MQVSSLMQLLYLTTSSSIYFVAVCIISPSYQVKHDRCQTSKEPQKKSDPANCVDSSNGIWSESID